MAHTTTRNRAETMQYMVQISQTIQSLPLCWLQPRKVQYDEVIHYHYAHEFVLMTLAGFPKALMESAIARGQGISTSGAALEKVTLEAMMPPSIAFVFDIETDNRLRTLGDVRLILKKNGATVTPTAYLFERKGRLVFDKDDRGLGVDDVLEDAIEAGAEDVHLDDKGNIVVWTDPSATTTAAEALSQSLKLAATSSEIIWSPNEDTMASVDTEETFNAVSSIMEALSDITGVSAYCNLAQGAVDDESWLELRDKFAA